MRMPNDTEILAAALQLTREGVPDLLDADGQVRHDKRAQVAKAIQMAGTETRLDQVAATNAKKFAARVRQLQDALHEEGVIGESSARVLGAVAAPLWRELKEKTAHDTKR